MNWKDELKNVAEINATGADINLDSISTFKANQEARKFINSIVEKFNLAKFIIEAEWTEVDIEKSNPERDRYICSISIKSSKHNNFKYSVILDIKNDHVFAISKEYVDGWVINGP